ncbi:MAG: Nif3-like dinuclear metal center hexameric protein [Chitinophagales bacterium]|nr:Nif3-like dinuclear metal center hexameric protein [Chitinophagales bacterium]MBP8754359.1 Nif3-like dinuclear metal center hexameric protein [Chitinophagales bacterium]MBP9188253.1 Nif3-like dinuclear metal center hexameric protein [Chitinophagales bacterium]MBP9550045.1 Nif3-like dinuclear metal center hexameric protein [Chitinophagales bacterium]MBP9797341.1 Nif3-like dinuclear metal center hexameric protein [Chitinophagales bacterium]
MGREVYPDFYREIPAGSQRKKSAAIFWWRFFLIIISIVCYQFKKYQFQNHFLQSANYICTSSPVLIKLTIIILQEIISHLESISPKSLQGSYDNSGLLVGDSNIEINSAVIALDVTEKVISDAIKTNSNLIIAHHPIIFGGIKN